MKLTDLLLKKKISSLVREAPLRPHRYCSLQEARQLLLIYHKRDREEVQICLNKLHPFQKRILTCEYVPSGTDEEEKADLVVRENEDTDLMLFPKDKVCRCFQELPADILIDLTPENNRPMHYLLLKHPAQLKVGRTHPKMALHDLSIRIPESEEIGPLFDYILFYLQSIRSK